METANINIFVCASLNDANKERDILMTGMKISKEYYGWARIIEMSLWESDDKADMIS